MKNSILRQLCEAVVVAAIYLGVVATAAMMRLEAIAYGLLWPAYATGWITGFWGGHGGEAYALPISALIAGILWLPARQIRRLSLRIAVFGTFVGLACGLGILSFERHVNALRETVQEQARKEREMLSSSNIDYAAHLQGKGRNEAEFIYTLIRNPDLAEPAVPALKAFILEDSRISPNSTVFRRLAAQAIYKASGERVEYRGVDEDRKRLKDPHDPNNYSERYER